MALQRLSESVLRVLKVSQFDFIFWALGVSFLLMTARSHIYQFSGCWLLNEAWSETSPQERTICEKTLKLSSAPKEGFAAQIDVTVAIALLIDWAAQSNIIAAQVLHMLLTGCVGDKVAWAAVRLRLAGIKKGLAKISRQSKSLYSPLSVKQRLLSTFWLPNGTSYPDIRTHTQQIKVDASASHGAMKCFYFEQPP